MSYLNTVDIIAIVYFYINNLIELDSNASTPDTKSVATYKVLQDIEAEDKLLGPLTLKQFIFAAIAVLCLYMSFFALTKHASYMLVILLPPAIIAGFLAWPWSRDQPTEVWLLAKIRFHLKPRRRIWNQDGMQQLVTITAPKKVDSHMTDDLSPGEVKSRLKALAETIDSRGWAIKNVNVNLASSPGFATADPTSDRLIDVGSLPREVPAIDITDNDDIFDNPTAQHFDQMIGTSTKEHREQVMATVNQLREQPQTESPNEPLSAQDLWFMQPGAGQQPAGYSAFNPTVVTPGGQTAGQPGADDQALLAQLHPDKDKPQAAYGHMKVIDPKGKTHHKAASHPHHLAKTTDQPSKKPATIDPAIIELAGNDDLNVATIARQANKTRGKQDPPDEVTVSLR